MAKEKNNVTQGKCVAEKDMTPRHLFRTAPSKAKMKAKKGEEKNTES